MGATKQWLIETAVSHTIRVQYALHSGRVLAYVDGQRILERKDGYCNWDDPFHFEFVVDNVPCKLLVTGIGCKLLVDGIQV